MKDSFNNSPGSDKELVIATTNSGKLAEIRSELSVLEIPLLSLRDFPDLPEAPETGNSFEENATSKARFYHQLLNKPLLAEDSGLVIPSLGGFPGIHSARIAEDDPSRIRIVLQRLQELDTHHELPPDGRLAFYVSSVVFVDREFIRSVEGRCHGSITRNPSGSKGFGFDPIFVTEGSTRTFAEMNIAEKSQLSHRGKALRQIIPYLQQRFRKQAAGKEAL
jgi:XTP/dITP diphosphohydrolase